MSKAIHNLIPVPISKSRLIGNFPKRPNDSHKGLFGTVAVIGGASGMIGAPLLAARAALKLGAGCVHVGMLAENAPTLDLQQPELMLHSALIALRLPNMDVYAIGCGLGTSIASQKLLFESLKRNTALVLDADALNLLSCHADLQEDLRNRKAATILTPHPGEAARLLECNIDEIQADRVTAVNNLSNKFACNIVLKGAGSLCITSDRQLFINTTGNPGMSSAGMGDILAGIIAAFIAQGMCARDAMLLAVHLHGAAADALAQQQATIGMSATEVTEWARWLLNKWL